MSSRLVDIANGNAANWGQLVSATHSGSAGSAGGAGGQRRHILVGAPGEQLPQQQEARVPSDLEWKTRLPRRVSKGTWYFVEDNTIPDFELQLQKFGGKGHGEVRCSSPTRRLMDDNRDAQRLMIGHYGEAASQAPNVVRVDVAKFATKELKEMRRLMDPNTQLRESVAETLSSLMKASNQKQELTTDQQAELVAKYSRVRDRFDFLRREFAAMEDEFELMQVKLLDVLGGPAGE